SLDPKKVAVERNLEIVPRSLHGETALAEGDKIELVQFVGGGCPYTHPGGRRDPVLWRQVRPSKVAREALTGSRPPPGGAGGGVTAHQIPQRRFPPAAGGATSLGMTDTAPRTDSWTVAGRTFNSRLIVGTGKYRDYAQNAAAAEASGAEMVTVAVRRVNLTDPNQPVLTDCIDAKKYAYLPNTAGCFTGEDAVRTLRLAREAGGWTLVKLEVLADPKTLFPDMEETLRSLKLLTAEGFEVMVYCTD